MCVEVAGGWWREREGVCEGEQHKGRQHKSSGSCGQNFGGFICRQTHTHTYIYVDNKHTHTSAPPTRTAMTHALPTAPH